MRRNDSLSSRIDWMVIIIVLILITFGIINLYSAAFDPERTFLFDIKTLYGKQFMWTGVGVFLGIVVFLIDSEYIRLLAIPAFIVTTFLLIAVLFTPAINGAHSWLGIGSFGIQPSEFAKLGTALAIAYIIHKLPTNRGISIKNVFLINIFLLISMVLVILQNDTGTFLVFTAFLFVMYREGITYDPIILFFLNRVLGFRFKSTWLGVHFIPVIFVVTFFAIITLFYADAEQEYNIFGIQMLIRGYLAMIIGMTLLGGIILALVLRFGSKRNQRSILSIVIISWLASVLLIFLVSFMYNNVLQSHQKDRIDLWLGKKEEPDGKDYNRNRALAAVGSGGFAGNGYQEASLASPEGRHVPESETDFIFSLYAEEWGFVGSVIVVILFSTLLVRIIMIAERQRSRFARVYAYSVAMIFFYHFAINIGMNIGFVPVIGIPLPFFSYGGSAMMSFMVMIIILLKLDSQRMDVLT